MRRLPSVFTLAVCLGVAGPATSQTATPAVWDNYDFVPGSKVLFYTDFSEDRVGNFARSLKFKAGRAAAVKAALVAQYGVASERLATKGLGDTKPTVPNTTAAGRARNRRVEIVKQ